MPGKGKASCSCFWKNCTKIQSSLSQDDIRQGFARFTVTYDILTGQSQGSINGRRFLRGLLRYLDHQHPRLQAMKNRICDDPLQELVNDGFKKFDIYVAKHHFHENILKLHTGSKRLSWAASITNETATFCGIGDNGDRAVGGGFIQVPNQSKTSVESELLAGMKKDSSRQDRRQSREEAQIHSDTRWYGEDNISDDFYGADDEMSISDSESSWSSLSHGNAIHSEHVIQKKNNLTSCCGIQHPRLKLDLLFPHWNFNNGRWYHENCVSSGPLKNGRCDECERAYNSIRADRFPLLFNDNTRNASTTSTRNSSTTSTTEDISSMHSCSPDSRKRRQSADSRVPFDILSPLSKTARYNNVARELRRTRKRLQRLEKRMEPTKNGFKIDVKDEKGRKFLLDIVKSVSGSAEKCIGLIIEELTLYVRSQKNYEAQTKISPWLLPSPDHLKRIKREMTLGEGMQPHVFGWMCDRGEYFDIRREGIDSSLVSAGIIMCDELCLRSGIAWSTSNHELRGFVMKESELNLASELSYFVEDEENVDDEEKVDDMENNEINKNLDNDELDDDGPYGLVQYVNQWRFRSIYGRTMNLEYYYNTGSLTGEHLLHQVMHTIRCLEFIGVMVLGINCDAGGGNTRLIRLLTEEAELNGYWLEDHCISFRNPACPSRFVAIFFCMTHVFKAMRNALFNSTGGKKGRTFIYPTAVPFGWKTIEQCYDRDQQLHEDMQNTDLTEDAVYPTRWSIMNVSLAKAPFQMKTITEIMCNIARLSGASPNILTLPLSQEGHELTRMDIFNLRLSKLQALTTGKPLPIRSDLSCVTYLTKVSIIFLEHFLNKNAKITLENFDSLKKVLSDQLKYFHDWRQSVHMLVAPGGANAGNKNWHKWLPSKKTWNNLRIGVCGFLFYAKLVLQLPENIRPKYVPFLHSNTSSLEAFFSMTRHAKKDDPVSYGSFVGTADISKEAEFLNRNKMYSREHAIGADEPTGIKDVGSVTGRKDKFRSKWANEMLGAFALPDSEHGEKIKMVSPERDFQLQSIASPTLSCIFEGIVSTTIPVSYQSFLLNDDKFREYVQLAASCPARLPWFDSLFSMNQNEIKAFDKYCQCVASDIVHAALLATNVNKKKKLNGLFWVQIRRYEVGDIFRQRTNLLPTQQLKTDRVCQSILLEVIAEAIRRQLQEKIETEKAKQDGKNTTITALGDQSILTNWNDIATLVNRIVGWSIDRVYFHLLNEDSELSLALQNQANTDDVESVREFVSQLTISHWDAMRDDSYFKKYYTTSVQVQNEGPMKLVTADFFEFCECLVRRVSRFSTKNLNREGGESVRNAFKQVIGGGILWEKFKLCTKKITVCSEEGADNPSASKISEEAQEFIFNQLCRRVFHAMTGRKTKRKKRDLTGQHSKKQQAGKNVPLRTELKVLSQRKKVIQASEGVE